tara:strand:+ start:1483 stop:1785 length:303 start_codon:yes stop_codon:yes gene_type:complete
MIARPFLLVQLANGVYAIVCVPHNIVKLTPIGNGGLGILLMQQTVEYVDTDRHHHSVNKTQARAENNLLVSTVQNVLELLVGHLPRQPFDPYVEVSHKVY